MVVKISRRLPCRRSPQIRAQQHRDQDRRSDNRHGQQDLKGGLGDELNGDGLPVRRREQRTALQEDASGPSNFTIACIA